jgi:nucleotide-binding universal stress UspA family protein
MFTRKHNGMFNTIVLALDGSDGARKAIPVAAEVAEKEQAKIVIAHVTEYMGGKGWGAPTHR